jgi:hypothetical protein
MHDEWVDSQYSTPMKADTLGPIDLGQGRYAVAGLR